MYNIPSNDPGVVLVPGDIETFCEWLVRLNGGIATCVESSEMMVDHLVKSGFPVSAAEDISLTQDLQNRGQAGPSGATDWVAASAQMTRLGIPNDAYGQSWFSTHDFVPVAQDAIRRGIPVLFGFSEAHNAFDTWTNQQQDAGVYGHAIALVGMDSTGAIVADPNTWQAKYGQFVHYTWSDLKSGGGAWPSMIVPRGSLMLDITQPEVAKYFTQTDAQHWTCKENQKVIAFALLSFYQGQVASLGGLTVLGLPLSNADYSTGKGTCIQKFERGVLVYDPGHILDSPPGAGPVYFGKISQFEPTGTVTVDADAGKDEATIAADATAMSADQSKIAKAQQDLK